MIKETREFWVSDEPDEAVRKAKITLNKLGALKNVVPHESISGEVSFGVQHIPLKITWRPEEVQPGLDKAMGVSTAATKTATTKLVGTLLMLEAMVPDGGSKAASQSVIERFEDAYLHFDRPDYKPDRAGVLPLTIIGITIAVGLLLFLLWRTPAVKKLLPKPPPSSKEKKDGDKDTQSSQADTLRIPRENGSALLVRLPAA
jgi:hypothetical protein